MKPVIKKDGTVSGELHKVDVTVLNSARAMGKLLAELHFKTEGDDLAKAVDSVLLVVPQVGGPVVTDGEEAEEKEGTDAA